MSSLFSSLRHKFSALKSETWLSSAPRVETSALGALLSSFRAARELIKATLCLLRLYLSSAFSFRKEMKPNSLSGYA